MHALNDFYRFTVISVLTACMIGLATGAPKEPVLMTPPPMAQPQRIGMYQGRSVEIPLRASGRSLTPIRFLIRTEPKNGHLGKVTLTGNNTAVVTYTHNEKVGPGSDTFTYAVQAVDSPVSAAARISLIISEEPPAFSCVHRLDFREIFLGETREEPLVIKNTGGGRVTGKINVTPPWKIIGRTEYSLGRRQETTLRLQFTPDEARDYEGQIKFSHDPYLAVDLHARVSVPVEFSPREIELSAAHDSEIRSASLTVKNLTTMDRIFSIEAPPEISSLSEITIPAESEAQISFKTKSGFLGSLEGTIALESDGFRQTFPIRVYSTPARLTISPPGTLDFGKTLAGSQYRRKFEIKNEGGAPTRITPELPTGLQLTSDPFGTPVQPGERRPFEVLFEPREPGEYQEIMRFSSPYESAQLPVIALVEAPLAAIPAGRILTLPTLPTSAPGKSETKPETYNDIAKVTDITVSNQEMSKAVLTWKPSPKTIRHTVEYRTVTPVDNAPPLTEWKEFPYIKYKEEGENISATLERMPPGAVWFVRIRAYNQAGQSSEPSDTIAFRTKYPSQPWYLLILVLLVPAGILARFIFVNWQSQQMQKAVLEAARIRRIEGK